MSKPNFILEQVSLKPYSWFGTDGIARYFVNLKNNKEFIETVSWAKQNNIKISILGLGANILISDENNELCIVKMFGENKSYEYLDEQTGILTVDAGFDFQEIILYAIATAHLFGLEEFSGIPSSVGAAIYINLHYYDFFIAQYIHSVQIYDTETNTIFTANQQWCAFGYDESTIKKNKRYIILSVSFILKRGTIFDSWYAQGRRVEIIRHRQNRYPHTYTCGCFFKNFNTTNPFLIKRANGKPITAASYYLDQANARAVCQHGNAHVSWQHANMIVHTGSATSADIISVARKMQKIVYQKYGLLLEPECELLGFQQYPLFTAETIVIEGSSQ